MAAINWVYRDQYVKQAIIDRYKIGESVIEPAYVDATKFRGGILSGCNLRYLIVSNKGHDWSLINEKANEMGLIVFPHGLNWKVLDKYELDGVTQLVLSPDEDITSYPIDDIITAARIHFNKFRNAPPTPINDTDEFKKRLFFPIGFTEKGTRHNLTE